MDRGHLCERSFDATVLRKIRKHLDPPHHVPAPAFARCFHLRLTDARLLEKVVRHIFRKLISEILLVRKLNEVFPDGPISIP
jgi:hypothetical protein